MPLAQNLEVQFPVVLCCHAFARLLAAAALFGTLFHHLITAGHALTILRTDPADVRAYPACELVALGAAQHEVRRCLAYLRAVEQEPDVSGVRMSSAELQTVIRRLEADRVTSHALVDAFLHLSRDVGSSGVVCHGILPLGGLGAASGQGTGVARMHRAVPPAA